MQQPFDVLASALSHSPDALAVVAPQGELSARDLLSSAVRCAHVLRARGVRPGQLVAVRAPALLDAPLSLALLHEAAIGTHLPDGFEAELADRFDWVLSVHPVPGIPAQKLVLIDLEFMAEASRASAEPSPIPYRSDADLCRVNFSSGTTGIPKAIGWSVDCLFDRAIDRRTQWMPAEPYLCLLGLPTGLAFMTFVACAVRHQPFLVPDTGAGLAAQITRFGVRAIVGSPTQLAELYRVASADRAAFSSVTMILSAGSVLPDFLAEQLARVCHAEVISTYASSEAGSVALRSGPGSADGYAGRLFDEVEVCVLDESGRALPDGEVGRIGVRRARQPQGYLFTVGGAGDDSFQDGFFFSGDLGLVRGRDLYLSGRETELINAGGTKVDPARLESVALGYPGITDAAVFSVRDATGVERIAMVCVSGDVIDPIVFGDWLRPRFGDAVPSIIIRVAEIARSSMGKVNRAALAAEWGPKIDQTGSLNAL